MRLLVLHQIWGVAAAVIASFSGAGAIIAGISKWTGHLWAEKVLEKDRHRYNAELEEIKSKYDSSVRRVQAFLDTQSFTKELHRKMEFDALTSIWKLVAKTRSEMSGLQRRLGIVMNRQGQSHFDWYQEQFPKFAAAAEAMMDAVQSQSPFYPKNIHDKLTEAVLVANTETNEGVLVDPSIQPPAEWWQQGARNIEKFVRLAEEVSDLIRDRLRQVSSFDEHANLGGPGGG